MRLERQIQHNILLNFVANQGGVERISIFRAEMNFSRYLHPRF
ncbi:Uncharacterised protein [Vibrio cholerae]|nr:Uncharacterised protein [Vibrio cholerae]